MADLSRLATSPEHESSGVWTPYALDIELCIARIPNAKFSEWVQEHSRLLQQQRTGGLITPASERSERRRVWDEGVIRFGLVGWKNVEIGGAAVPFDADRAVEILSRPEYHDMLTFIDAFATNASNYRRWRLDEAVGNSPAPSPGD